MHKGGLGLINENSRLNKSKNDMSSFQVSGDAKEGTPNSFQAAPSTRKFSCIEVVNRKQ